MAGEPPAKQARSDRVTLEELERRIRATPVLAKAPAEGAFIATHHGSFHADEAMACAMLKTLEEYRSLPIVRTRDPADIDKAKIVVDVGAVYDPSKLRYDHHQATFKDTYSEEYAEIKLSSAGLVYKHHGSDVVAAITSSLEPAMVEKIVAKTYDSLIRELDALDNGVMVADNPRYRICTHLGSRVGRLNPGWQEVSTPELENSRFVEAMSLAAKELTDIVGGYSDSWLPARTLVEEALAKRMEVHPSGEVMKLVKCCPWQEHLFDLEAEEEKWKTPSVKYVLFTDSRGSWRIQAVPKEKGSFENRQPLPKAWRGVRDQELSDLLQLPGCIFVHAAGFIGGHSTEEGILTMAKKAVEEFTKP